MPLTHDFKETIRARAQRDPTDLRLRSGVGFGGNRLTGLELSK